MKRTLLIVMAAACVLAGTAHADGDPASDYLLGTQVFLPYDIKLPAAKQPSNSHIGGFLISSSATLRCRGWTATKY